MIRLWGGKSVANVQKVLWCLGELGLAFEYCGPVGEFSEDYDARYVASKAPGAVPVIDEDGFVLWEGNAIVRYLARRFATGSLWPDDGRKAASVERWMDYQLSTVREHVHPLIRADLDAAGLAFHTAQLAATLAPLEAALADHAYLAGDDFTVADIPLGINVYRWYLMDVPKPAMPHVAAWYARLKARPAFVAAIVPPAMSKVQLKTG